MVREIIGKKLGMTRLFSEDGNIVPVTVIEAGPCPIIQKKTKDKDGYNAIQVGFLSKKPNRVNRPLMGHFKKSGKGAFYVLKELKVNETESYELGQEIGADIVKSYYTGDPDSFNAVVEGCPAPVVILGGEKTDDLGQVFTEVHDSVQAGGAGIAIGRNIWQHVNPQAVVEAMVGLVHEGWSVKQALKHCPSG